MNLFSKEVCSIRLVAQELWTGKFDFSLLLWLSSRILIRRRINERTSSKSSRNFLLHLEFVRNDVQTIVNNRCGLERIADRNVFRLIFFFFFHALVRHVFLVNSYNFYNILSLGVRRTISER